MGSNLYIATERARDQAKLLKFDESSEEEYELFNENVTSLSRQFSYALLRDDGQFRKDLAENEVKALEPDDIDYPDHWRSRDPQQLLEILCRVKECLEREAEQMPVDHFLWFVDEEGKRWGGSTQITLPFEGIELKVPHNPIVKLDGGHQDPNHRWELCKYDVHVDANLLAQLNREMEREVEDFRTENNITSLDDNSFISYGFTSYSARIDPLVEEPVGWIPVQPILDVLGYRVEVESVDALSSFQPDLNRAIECCEQAIRTDAPFYWLIG